MTIDQAVWDRALARMDEIERTPTALQPEAVEAPVVAKPKKIVHVKPKPKKEVRETTKPKEKEPVNFDFVGRAVDSPLFHEAAAIFGKEAEDLSSTDRNAITEVVQLTAERLGTTDAYKILNYISKESHQYPGSFNFREMRAMLRFKRG